MSHQHVRNHKTPHQRRLAGRSMAGAPAPRRRGRPPGRRGRGCRVAGVAHGPTGACVARSRSRGRRRSAGDGARLRQRRGRASRPLPPLLERPHRRRDRGRGRSPSQRRPRQAPRHGRARARRQADQRALPAHQLDSRCCRQTRHQHGDPRRAGRDPDHALWPGRGDRRLPHAVRHDPFAHRAADHAGRRRTDGHGTASLPLRRTGVAVNRRLVSTPAGWVAVAACATLAAAVSLAAALLVLVARTRTAHLWRVAALITAAAAMGLLRGAVDGGPPVLVRAPHSGTTVLTGTVRDGTGSRRTASQVIVDAQRMETADGPVDVSGGVLATLRTPAQVLPGDQVELDATGLRPLRAAGAEAGLLRDGVSAVAQSATITVLAEGGPSPSRLLAQARLGLASTVDAALPEPGSSLVNALAFALPQPLPATLTAALRDSGLAHMLATSGLKVVLVAGVIASLLAALATPPRLRLTLMAASVGGYILLCGASPAAVRSALMAATGWTLYGSGRSADPLPLLAAVAAAMLVVSPG